jgi:hypothetical protein
MTVGARTRVFTDFAEKQEKASAAIIRASLASLPSVMSRSACTPPNITTG